MAVAHETLNYRKKREDGFPPAPRDYTGLKLERQKEGMTERAGKIERESRMVCGGYIVILRQAQHDTLVTSTVSNFSVVLTQKFS